MRPVPDYGPYDAPLLVVGEAGGATEGRKGKPYQGAVGQRTRSIIKAYGLDPDQQVRYANVIPFEMPALPQQVAAMQAIVRQHWTAVEATLARGTHKAVLAHGRAAAWRLAGVSGILDAHGSVREIEVGGVRVPLVLSIHPASVMRSKIEAGWELVSTATGRAVRYAQGEAVRRDRQQPTWEWCYGWEPIDALHKTALASGWPVAIDTEFSKTNRPFLIGLSVDGEKVLSVVPNDETMPALRHLCNDPHVTKVLHHTPADVTSLAVAGIPLRPPLVNTLLLHATIWPDLPVGLERCALHLFDHWVTWKDMAHDDPAYNAIDVVATWRLFALMHPIMEREGLWPLWNREVRHIDALCWGMETRGLYVDKERQAWAVESNSSRAEELRADIKARVDEMFATRRGPVEAAGKAAVEEIEVLKTADFGATGCVEHPNYTGLVKPRGKDKGACTCFAIYVAREADREKIKTARKARDRSKTVVARWADGFDLGNNEHLRWLLYDKQGFALNVQRNPTTGRPTANANAIARLLALKKTQDSPVIRDVLTGVKRYQHMKKMTSTFLLWDEGRSRPSEAIDVMGCAHPGYRPWAGTGRLMGGDDIALDDKKVNPFAYNALNIPEETRSIYVPRPAGQVPQLETVMFDADTLDEEIDDDYEDQ